MNVRFRRFGLIAIVAVAACTPFGPPDADGGDGAALGTDASQESPPQSGPIEGGNPDSSVVGATDGPEDLSFVTDASVREDLSARDSTEAAPPDARDAASTEASADQSTGTLGPPGSLIWAKPAVLDGDIVRVAALPDDTIVAAGAFHGTAHFGPTTDLVTPGDEDAFLARYTSDGQLKWAVQAGGSQDDEVNGVAVLPSGNLVVVGSFSGTAVFGQGRIHQVTLTSAGSSDLFLASYNSDGDLQWAYRAGGLDSDSALGVAARSDGDVSVRGFMLSDSSTGFVNTTSLGDFIARVGINGDAVWAKSYTTSTLDPWGCLAVRPDGTSVICGYSESSVSFWSGNQSPLVVPVALPVDFIVGVTGTGEAAWTNHAVVSGSTISAQFAIALPGGETVTTGTLLGDTEFQSYQDQSSNVGENPSLTTIGENEGTFVARYDATGILLSVGTLSATRLTGIGGAPAGDGSVVVAGTFEGAFVEKSSVRSAGGADVFVATVGNDGRVGWIAHAGGSGDDSVFPPVVLSDGSVVLIGDFVGTATFGKGEANETQLVAPQSGTGRFFARFSP